MSTIDFIVSETGGIEIINPRAFGGLVYHYSCCHCGTTYKLLEEIHYKITKSMMICHVCKTPELIEKYTKIANVKGIIE